MGNPQPPITFYWTIEAKAGVLCHFGECVLLNLPMANICAEFNFDMEIKYLYIGILLYIQNSIYYYQAIQQQLRPHHLCCIHAQNCKFKDSFLQNGEKDVIWMRVWSKLVECVGCKD